MTSGSIIGTLLALRLLDQHSGTERPKMIAFDQTTHFDCVGPGPARAVTSP